MARFANVIVDISHEKLDKTFQYRIPQEMRPILHLVFGGYSFWKPNDSRVCVELTDELGFDISKINLSLE